MTTGLTLRGVMTTGPWAIVTREDAAATVAAVAATNSRRLILLVMDVPRGDSSQIQRHHGGMERFFWRASKPQGSTRIAGHLEIPASCHRPPFHDALHVDRALPVRDRHRLRAPKLLIVDSAGDRDIDRLCRHADPPFD